MIRTSRYILFAFVALVVVTACGGSDPIVPLMYKDYREGPHIKMNPQGTEGLYFDLVDDRWEIEEFVIENLENATIIAENPVFGPMSVPLRARESTPPSEYPDSDKITVVADIEGDFVGLYTLLLSQGVIDSAANWTYGDGHLVMLGDLFDRGSDVTPIFWMLYKLEAEAQRAGGYVHTLLGNHEIMIFRGDTRYITKKYSDQSKETGIAYSHLFDNQTILGRWLRSKPALVRIGNKLYSHAGVSVDVMRLALSLEEINAIVRTQNARSKPDETDPTAQLIFGSEGVFWYRDWVENTPAEAVLNGVLGTYYAEHMIVGHTVVRKVTATYDYKLIAADLHRRRDKKRGIMRALLIEGDRFFEIDNSGHKTEIVSDAR